MKKLFLILTIILLSACAQLGLTGPQSFDQKLGATLATVGAVEQSTATALALKSITVADAKEVLNLSGQIRLLVLSARDLEHTDLTTAAGKYTLATSILTQLQTYTTARGIK